jgi:predicted GTPase
MRNMRVLILGAAGRDFHNFNVAYRDDPQFEVVGFTAAQIPNIEGRRYPAALAGDRYPQGIPVFPEQHLAELVRRLSVDEVVFAYSDVSHEDVMHLGSIALAAGADFRLLGPDRTMLEARVPVISVCAVRTGAGKSQTTRRLRRILSARGKRVVVVRHPMPYGDLVRQRVQRFATFEDLDRAECTIEEREEYEPHLAEGVTVYAGVDYAEVLRQAQEEADLIIWDGGNNDLPFFRPSLEIVVADPHRAGHETRFHPGEANVRRAHVVVINKVSSAGGEATEQVRENIRRLNPSATLVDAASPFFVDEPALVRGKRALAVEDGPTVTHGQMPFGAAVLAARRFGASEIIDPRPAAVGSLTQTFARYPHLTNALPAMGYGEEQIRDLKATIDRSGAEVVVFATPVDLRRLLALERPAVRVRYELQEIGKPDLEDVVEDFLSHR